MEGQRQRRFAVGFDGSIGAGAALDYALAGARGGGEVVIVYGYGPPADWLGTPNLRGILESRRDLGRGACSRSCCPPRRAAALPS